MSRLSLLLFAAACTTCNAFMVPAKASLANPSTRAVAVTPLAVARVEAPVMAAAVKKRVIKKRVIKKVVAKKIVKKPVKKPIKKRVIKKVVAKKIVKPKPKPRPKKLVKPKKSKGAGTTTMVLSAGNSIYDSFAGYGGGRGGAALNSPFAVGGVLVWVFVLLRYVLFFGLFE